MHLGGDFWLGCSGYAQGAIPADTSIFAYSDPGDGNIELYR